MATGFNRADAIASLAVAGLMLHSGYVLQRRAVHVLLEGAPDEAPPREVGEAMAQMADVREVHDLHVWELTPGQPILTAHVLVTTGADCHGIRRALELMLRHRFHIEHTTLQVDHAPPALVVIQRGPRRP